MQNWKTAVLLTVLMTASLHAAANATAALPVSPAAAATESAGKETKEASPSLPAMQTSSHQSSSLKSLMPIDGKPLTSEDFIVGGITFGQSLQDVEKNGGPSLRHSDNGYVHQYEFKDFSVLIADDFMYRYMERKDLNLTSKFSNQGVSALIVNKPGMYTARHIEIGDSRESVLRAYGQPSEVLWDGKKSQFYLIYSMQDKQFIFTIKDDKVSDFRISSMKPFREAREDYKDIRSTSALPMKDFKIAGYELNTEFKPYPWDDWTKKMTNAKEEVRYYHGYAVRIGKKSQIIRGLFIEDPQMLTNRGISVGDDVSTLDLLYGAPAKIELDTTGHSPRSCYIYFSVPKGYMLLFYVENQKISSIASALQPHLA